MIFASNIEDKALLKPSLIDCFKPFSFNSSLTLSKIRTFASTDIPMVRTIQLYPVGVRQHLNQLKFQILGQYLILNYISKYTRWAIVKYHPN